jgi:hypothetical protein
VGVTFSQLDEVGAALHSTLCIKYTLLITTVTKLPSPHSRENLRIRGYVLLVHYVLVLTISGSGRFMYPVLPQHLQRFTCHSHSLPSPFQRSSADCLQRHTDHFGDFLWRQAFVYCIGLSTFSNAPLPSYMARLRYLRWNSWTVCLLVEVSGHNLDSSLLRLSFCLVFYHHFSVLQNAIHGYTRVFLYRGFFNGIFKPEKSMVFFKIHQ